MFHCSDFLREELDEYTLEELISNNVEGKMQRFIWAMQFLTIPATTASLPISFTKTVPYMGWEGSRRAAEAIGEIVFLGVR